MPTAFLNYYNPGQRVYGRKISADSVDAFLAGRRFKRANMRVDVHVPGLHNLYLHDNRIAYLNCSSDSRWHLSVCMCGWNTPTTRERINVLFQALQFKAYVCQRDFEPWFVSQRPTSKPGVTITEERRIDSDDVLFFMQSFTARPGEVRFQLNGPNTPNQYTIATTRGDA